MAPVTGRSTPPLEVLVGNHEESLTLLIRAVLEKAAGCSRTVHLTVAGGVEDLIEHAVMRRFDLCLLVVNNLHGLPRLGGDRVGHVVNAIATVKSCCPMPVIAFAGWPPDPDFGDRVLAAGADHFERLPFKVQAVVRVLKRFIP